jgi:hypothetical protein
MKVIKKAMGKNARVEDLEQVEERFTHWCQTRRSSERMPEALWTAAVDMAMELVAERLRISEDELIRRLGYDNRPTREGAPDFVELFAPLAPQAASISACVVELSDARGTTMRIELKVNDVVSLANLSSALWRAA